MRSRTLLALLALATTLPACGGSTASAPATAAATAPPAKAPPAAATAGDELAGPFLWEVKGTDGPSYLFGTIHAGFQGDKELPPVVWDRLAAVDGFVMEADLTSVSPMALMQRAALPDGQRLDALLGEADWKKLIALVGAGVPHSSLKLLAPWFAYSLVIQTLYPTPTPLDLALQRRATELGKETTYLEDWSFQIDLLSEVMGVEELRELLADQSKARTQLDAMVAAYRAGDFQQITALALDPDEVAAHPERMKRMFEDRNRAWIDALAPRLTKGGLFVAVGVGHFAGPTGMLALLRERGFEVRRVVR